jgi:hypothetical protein
MRKDLLSTAKIFANTPAKKISPYRDFGLTVEVNEVRCGEA